MNSNRNAAILTKIARLDWSVGMILMEAATSLAAPGQHSPTLNIASTPMMSNLSCLAASMMLLIRMSMPPAPGSWRRDYSIDVREIGESKLRCGNYSHE